MAKQPEDEEKQLFRQAMKGVRRLTSDKATLSSPRPKAQVRKQTSAESEPSDDQLSDGFEPIAELINDELSFYRVGLQKQTLRKLRQGKFPIEAELDLHGLRVEQARTTLFSFINSCQARGLRCVRVIHGKGGNMEERHGKLKTGTNRWLQQIDAVLAFYSAQPKDGGSGAVYVLLERG